MKYTCIVIDNTPRERPLVNYTNSLAEARRWAGLLVKTNPTSKVEIHETRLELKETIRAQQTAFPQVSTEQTDSH